MKIETNHQLALELWETVNVEARLLATLIIKPQELAIEELDRLVQSEIFIHVTDWLNAYDIKQHPHNETLRKMWMKSKNPVALRAGWSLTASRVEKNPEGLDMTALLDHIETEMTSAPSEAQWTMNMTLAQIGIFRPELRKRAVSIGEKLGIYRDYPVSKGCTSPFVPVWISEMVTRNEK